MSPEASIGLAEDNTIKAAVCVSRVAAERLEHFSAQAASFAQSPFSCLSQSFPCGQQSECVAVTAEFPGKRPFALAPAIGTKATENAIKTMSAARMTVTP
jgi:hypothetical protein